MLFLCINATTATQLLVNVLLPNPSVFMTGPLPISL